MRPSAPLRASLLDKYKTPDTVSKTPSESNEAAIRADEERRKSIWASTFSWVENGDGKESGYDARFLGGKANRVVSLSFFKSCVTEADTNQCTVECFPPTVQSNDDTHERNYEPFLWTRTSISSLGGSPFYHSPIAYWINL